jgi:hypothetical protein
MSSAAGVQLGFHTVASQGTVIGFHNHADSDIWIVPSPLTWGGKGMLERTLTCLHVQNIYDENFNFWLWFTQTFMMNSHFLPVHSSTTDDFCFAIVYILAWKERSHACIYIYVQNNYDDNFNVLLWFTLPFELNSHFFPIHSSSIDDFRFAIVYIQAWTEHLHACMYRTLTR